MCSACKALRRAERSSMGLYRQARIPPKKRRMQQVYASLHFEYVTPMLLGAGAYSTALLADHQDQLNILPAFIQLGRHHTDCWVAALQAPEVAAGAALAAMTSAPVVLKPNQRNSTANVHAEEQQQHLQCHSQQDEQQQEGQYEENSKLLAVIQRQQQQLEQLARQKQQLQQQVKKQAKEQEKLQSALASAESQLSVLQQQHASATLEVLQLRSDLDRANIRLKALQINGDLCQQQTAEGQGKSSSSSSGSVRDDQPQCPTSSAGPAVAAASALEPSVTLRIAFVGGRNMKKSYLKMLPPGAQVRHFGSSRDMGNGEIEKLEACIKAGTIDQVYMLIRWNGHSTTQLVNRLCRQRGIPVHLLDSTQMARKKGQRAAEEADASASATSMSDDDSNFL